MRRKAVLCVLPFLWPNAPLCAAELTNLVANPGFEEGREGWVAATDGFELDTEVRRGGSASIRCAKTEDDYWVGCWQEVVLDQERPTPIVAWGWCRTQEVTKTTSNSLCLWLDIEFRDDTRPNRVDWPGQTVPFDPGTHDWQYRELMLNPDYPIKSLKMHLLFRGAPVGTAWFDDIGLAEVSTGPLAGGPDELPSLPPDALPGDAREFMSGAADAALAVIWRGARLAVNGEDLQAEGALAEGFSAATVAPAWRGEVPAPAPPDSGCALYFMRRWDRRSLVVEHGVGSSRLWVALPRGTSSGGIELRDWDVRDDTVGLYQLDGRVVALMGFEGDETADRLIVRLDVPGAEAAAREKPDELLTIGSAEGLGLGFGPRGGLWSVACAGQECADAAVAGLGRDAADSAGLFVGALDDGELHLVGDEVRLAGNTLKLSMSCREAELRADAQITRAEGYLTVQGEVRDMRGVDRAVDVLLSLPIANVGWRWHDDIIRSWELDGETGAETQDYPIAAMTRSDGSAGLGIALDPLLPVNYRLGFEPKGHRLYLRLKLGLAPDHKLKGRAPFSFMLAAVDPDWGMRELLAKWYRAFPAAFERRATKEGGWLFAIAPPELPNPQDYGYYEGNPAHAEFNEQHGIVTCPYVIPGQRSITRLEALPASYEEAMAAFERYDPSVGTFGPQVKELITNCRVIAPDGRYPIRIRDDVGADIKPKNPINMVVFSTNPDPDLMADQDKLNVGKYTLDQISTMIAGEPRIGGIYVDSCAGWVARYLNLRRDHFAYADYPLTYEEETGRVGIMGATSVVEFLKGLGELLHREGRVVFPNISSGRRFCWYYFFCDVCGLEGRQHDLVSMAFFRSTAYHKPTLRLDYLGLLGTETALSTREGIEEYFKNCIAYGVYPSIGRRADEAYERFRGLFDAYMPPLRTIGAAGWEPVTLARLEGGEGAVIERFGPAQGKVYFTVYNPTDEAIAPRATVDEATLGAGVGPARDLVTGESLALDEPLNLQPGRLMAIEIELVRRQGLSDTAGPEMGCTSRPVWPDRSC